MKLITAALAASLALPSLFGASDAAARERATIRVGPVEATIYRDHRAHPRPVRPDGRWEWQAVTTREPDRIERVWVEQCRTRGRRGRVQKCKGRWEERVVPGAERVSWQWVWVERHVRHARAW